MPLTIDSIVRQNSGGVAAATSGAAVVVSLAGGETTEAGNTLFVFLGTGNGQRFSTTAPAGWVRVQAGAGTDAGQYVYYRGPNEGLAAGESSWNFTPTQAPAGPVRWTVYEIEGVASGTITDVTDAFSGSGIPTIVSSGTTAGATAPLSSTYDGLAFSVHNSYNPSATDSWSSHTDSFVELLEGSQAGSGSDNVTLSISARSVDSVGVYGSTATCSRVLTGTNSGTASTFLLNAAEARKAANLRLIDGAEHGLITGNTLGPVSNKVLETVTAGVSVSGTAARSGSYGWLLSSSSAACNFTKWGSAMVMAALGVRSAVCRYFRFPTLPAADTEMLALTTLSGTSFVLRYINASQKLGLKIGAGAEIVSDQTVTANQWFGVHLKHDSRAATYLCDWQVDYNAELTDTTAAVVQSQASGAGSAGSNLSAYRVGWTTALTATMHTDDGVGSGESAHYPLGDIRVLPLKVDPADTPTISGTSTNFGVMTANGATIAAWNAVNARNAIDDVPPDLSGTRDAAICLLAHASDYAQFPMETLDMAAAQVNVRGVAWVACLWAASGTAATIRLRSYEGTTEYSGLSEQDPGADNTSTPVWATAMIRPTSGRVDWTQAKVDALAFRMGSNDATPDIGIDCVVFELAVVKAQPENLFGEAGAPTYVEAHRDPDTQALVGATVTNNSGDPVELAWEVDGVPDSSGSIPDGTTDQYVPMSPDGGIQTVGRVDLNPG